MLDSTLTRALTGALAALALGAPAAQAKETSVPVCNEATPHSLYGELDALDNDPLPPARYQEDLKRHPGVGEGLVNAAGHSPALAVCGEAGGDGGGDDDTAS